MQTAEDYEDARPEPVYVAIERDVRDERPWKEIVRWDMRVARDANARMLDLHRLGWEFAAAGLEVQARWDAAGVAILARPRADVPREVEVGALALTVDQLAYVRVLDEAPLRCGVRFRRGTDGQIAGLALGVRVLDGRAAITPAGRAVVAGRDGLEVASDDDEPRDDETGDLFAAAEAERVRGLREWGAA
jgi:hypothetical protein